MIGRIENPSCSSCRHLSQNISHLIVHCPVSDSVRHSLFGDSLSLYDPVSRHASIPRKGSGNNSNIKLRQKTASLAKPGFHIAKWTSSSPQLLATIYKEDIAVGHYGRTLENCCSMIIVVKRLAIAGVANTFLLSKNPVTQVYKKLFSLRFTYRITCF